MLCYTYNYTFLSNVLKIAETPAAAALAAEVDKLAAIFGTTADKLVAQTYDGATVMSGDKHGVQRLVKKSSRNQASYSVVPMS